MNALTLFMSALLISACFAETTQSYPSARRSDLVEDLHGVKVADPYRWMEEIDSPETRSYVEAQARLATNYLAKLPRREEIGAQLKKLWDYDRLGLPHTEGGRVFFSRRAGLQNQAVLFWKDSAPGASEKVLLDVNTMSKDGTVALSSWRVSRDGKLLAYGLSKAGSDWVEWRFREVQSGRDLPDVLKWVKFSGAAWNHDGTAVYYSRYDEPPPGAELKQKNENQKLYLHRLGDAPEKDTLLYARADKPKWGFGAGETDDGKYLLVSVWEGSASENALFYRDLAVPSSPLVELLRDFDAEYRFVGNDGPLFYLLTSHQAKNQRLVAVDINRPAPDQWRTILPESKSRLSDVSYLGGKFIATRLVDAHDEVSVYDREGKELKKLTLPGLCSVAGFAGRQSSSETHYYVTSFTTPGEIYRYDVARDESTLVERTKVAFDASRYEVGLRFYPSKDGTQIPLFLCHRKGLVKDGRNPTLLYGYGGFDHSLTPSFSASQIAWMDLGGVYAQACLRGGGEYGESWHEAGKGKNKQNVFDDFIAAAEWLIRENYTRTPKLAIHGGSNGGLLVAAVMNQRPELFGAAIPAVGVMDMLRFHKFTIGWAWQKEYGSPDQPGDFRNLLTYSPLHGIKSGVKYPPTMILTGDHDDRVFPAHSFKYAAALQHAQAGPAPILLRVDLDTGHGAGKPTAKALEETTDKFAFLAEALKM